MCIISSEISIIFSSATHLFSDRQSTKFQNHENINFVEKLYFFILYNQAYIAKHVVKSLHSGIFFREIQVITKLEGKGISKLRYFLLSYNIAHTVQQVQLK